MIKVCDLSFANNSITDTLGNYSLVSSGTVTISGHTYPANTDPILYGTDSSYNYVEFGQTATYSNGAIIQAGIPDYGSENWAVEFRARVPSVPPVNTGPYVLFFGCSAPYDDNGTIRTGGYWAISIDASMNTPDELRFFYDYNNEDLTLKDNLDFTAWHLYKVTKTAEDILTLHIDGVLVATIDIEQQTGFKSRATLGSFALLGAVEEFPTDNRIQTNQSVRLADVKVYADPMGHAEKAISLDNLSRVFRNYNTWLSSQLSGQIGDGTLTIKVNGATAGTFTANQSTAATANITVPVNTSDLVNDSGYLTSSSNLDASKLTSGTVDIERLPQGALERLIKVANEAARYALTTADVQLGDTVQQLDTGIMYVVTDTDHLDSAAGYTEYTAGTAASVPWSGVTGKPTFAAVATSGAYSDLTGTPTIPTVNNATLTIQRNGTTIDTFTANASVDKTINISTTDDTKIPLAGSNQISGSLIPSTDNSIDIGSSTKNLKMLYTKGITIDGTQFLLSNYMTLNTTQTVTSTKNYSGYQNINGYRLRIKSLNQEKGVIPQSNQWNGFYFTDKNDEIIFSFDQGMLANGTVKVDFSGRANDNNTTLTTFLQYINNSDLTVNCVNVIDLMPFENGTRKLGDTNAKWKSFNGINPGALSLPSNSYVNVDTTNWVLDGSNVNIFTPASDGWLGIQCTDTVYDQMHYVFVGRNDSVSYYSQNVLSPINALWDSKYHGCVFIPVLKGVTYHVRCVCGSIIATFYPCQGNV